MYIQGVVVSSIGNSTLYDPQIRGGVVELTVVYGCGNSLED